MKIMKKAMVVLSLGLGLGLSSTAAVSGYCEYVSQKAYVVCGASPNGADCQYWAEQAFLCGVGGF
jgi:hypothetical protein